MNLVDIKRKILNYYINSRGWTTSRKLVVIESDDWGSIRMPSKDVYDEMLAKGFSVNKLSYLNYDWLESNSDLEELLDVLLSFRDKNGNHPVVTANTIMTNPDFDRIRESGFTEYYYELFPETLKHYPEHDRVFCLYLEGIHKKIFYPQLHGLEHLNVRRWMKKIKDEKSNARIAFNAGLFDMSSSHTTITDDSFIDALSPENDDELKEESERLIIACEMFKTCFGYKSDTFIAPCYIWRPELESALRRIGIMNIQSGIYQLVPEIGKVSSFKKKYHFTGERNAIDQSYTVRNCFFEPSTTLSENVVDDCLIQIERAFAHQKPAVITSHRINYIGFIQKENQIRNLKLLRELLTSILKRWPDSEFITSSELARLLRK